MLKFKNEKGETVFKIEDDDSKPKTVDDECLKCKQKGDAKSGEYPCPECDRPLIHDEDEPEGEE